MSRRPAAAPTRLLSALVASVVTGLLLAVAAFPIVGGLGLTAKAGAKEFLVLPDELKTSPLAERTRILASDGKTELAVLYRENRVNAALLDIPEMTRKAVIASEDARFYAHNGVDYKGTARAAIENAKAGGVSQGGSTLTQQYVKNALLQAARGSREEQEAARELSIDRKLKEARYALAIEKELSKDQILERYLNIAYYGNGVYGMGTAANFYFSKPVQQLTLAEGALLAGIVQSPTRFDPVKATENPAVLATLLARRDIVLTRMVDVGFITEAERAAAAAERGAPGKALFAIQPVTSGCENPEVKAPFFCDYLRRALEDTDLGKALGNTREERQDKLLAGGLTIITTLDPAMQQAAQAAADENVPRTDPFGAGAVVDMVEPGTGKVKAMAVNRTYSELKQPGHTKVNLAIGGSAGFQSGSTFKAFVLAEALKQGIPLDLTLYSPVQYQSKECKTNDPDNNNKRIPYAPKNAGDSEAGTFDLSSGTHKSVNTYYIQILDRTGVPGVAATAESLGVRKFENGAPTGTLQRGGKFDGCAIVLGADNVSPLDMAGAYATFAARGLHCKPTPVLEIRDAKGQPIDLTQPGCTQVLDPAIADTVNQVLTGVIDGRGTGSRAAIGRPAAGKTGTTNGSTAAWFIGYTPQLATAVWMGDPGGQGPGDKVDEMVNVKINGKSYSQVYGGTIPAVIFKQAMTGALRDVPPVDFTTPGKATVQGKDIVVPDVRGLPLPGAEALLIGAGFSVRNGGRVAAAPVPNGFAAYTSPRAGRTLRFGETVTLYSSSGRGSSGGATAPQRPRTQAPEPEPEPEPQPQPQPQLPEPQPEQAAPDSDPAAAAPGNGNGRPRG